LAVRRRLRRAQTQAGRDPVDAGQSKRLEDADVRPADIEFIRLDGELRRGRISVMVVVQLLAADEDSPRHEIAARVGRLEASIAPPVTDAVDDACGGDRNPEHLHGPDGGADGAEQEEIEDEGQADTLPAVPFV